MKEYDTKEYKAYHGMLQRCGNPKDKQFKNYGARGIKVEYESFEAFLADVGRAPSPQYSIDRIDNNGNYKAGNCRWATAKEQANNKRKREQKNRVLFEQAGIPERTFYWRKAKGLPLDQCLEVRQKEKELIEQSGVAERTFYWRKAKGWTLEECLFGKP